MKRFIHYSILIILVLTCIGCIFLSIKYEWFKRTTITCSPPPDWFSEKDLAGKWTAWGDDVEETIIIREDGTYKQIIFINLNKDNEPVEYETEWQSWSLEYGSEKEIPYLFLQGFRVCGSYANYGHEVDCNKVFEGRTVWSDCCSGYPRERELGETILTIVGPPNYREPSGTMEDVELIDFAGCEIGAWHFRYQGEK